MAFLLSFLCHVKFILKWPLSGLVIYQNTILVIWADAVLLI